MDDGENNKKAETDNQDKARLPEKQNSVSGVNKEELVQDLLRGIEDGGMTISPTEGGMVVSTTEIRRTGPLPSADEFRQYDEVLPGAANRILAMAEKEQNARQQIGYRVLANNRWKIVGSILVSLTFVGCAAYIAYLGIVAPAVVVMGGLGIVGALIDRIFPPKKKKTD